MKTLRGVFGLVFDHTLLHFFKWPQTQEICNFLAQKKLYTSNHTCNQKVECKIIPEATQKNIQNGLILGNFHFFKKPLSPEL